MKLRTKSNKGKSYYYLDLDYRIINKHRNFSKYIGLKKPSTLKLSEIENSFKDEIIRRFSGKSYSSELISKDDVIKSFLFREVFNKKYNELSPTKRKKYDVDATIVFTLTTLTTEDVDVSLQDVTNAYEKESHFNMREKISKNMINAVETIKKHTQIDKKYLLRLHKIALSEFETKTPGLFRTKQVYIHKKDEKNPLGIEISYRPPAYEKINKLIDEFIEWYNKTNLNPIEKSALAHYKLYTIHPFLDGNKRISRLLLNQVLLSQGFPLLNISCQKEKYFYNLIKSVEEKNPQKFVKFTLEKYLKQVKGFLK